MKDDNLYSSTSSWRPDSPYHELQKIAYETGKAQIAPDGMVILANRRTVCPLEFNKFADDKNWIRSVIENVISNRDGDDEDTLEEFYDFGPPADLWDEFESPFEMPENADPSGFYEDLATREYFSPSQQREQGDLAKTPSVPPEGGAEPLNSSQPDEPDAT